MKTWIKRALLVLGLIILLLPGMGASTFIRSRNKHVLVKQQS